MTLKPRNFAQVLIVAGAAASVAVAPIAAADPTGVPEAGSESASATIKDLRTQGFNVSIKGSVVRPMSRCQRARSPASTRPPPRAPRSL
jgi:hypothetical protein